MSVRSKFTRTLAVAGAGAAAAHLFDPQQGQARRNRLRDQVLSRSRRFSETVESRARYTEGRLEGARARAEGRGEMHPADDGVIKQGVEQRLAATGVDTNDIVVDVTDGVVGLRGQARTPEDVKRLRSEASAVPGVDRVQSWLHLPGQPAPNKADSLHTTS